MGFNPGWRQTVSAFFMRETFSSGPVVSTGDKLIVTNRKGVVQIIAEWDQPKRNSILVRCGMNRTGVEIQQMVLRFLANREL